jgi:hypothetical protein
MSDNARLSTDNVNDHLPYCYVFLLANGFVGLLSLFMLEAWLEYIIDSFVIFFALYNIG